MFNGKLFLSLFFVNTLLVKKMIWKYPFFSVDVVYVLFCYWNVILEVEEVSECLCAEMGKIWSDMVKWSVDNLFIVDEKGYHCVVCFRPIEVVSIWLCIQMLYLQGRCSYVFSNNTKNVPSVAAFQTYNGPFGCDAVKWSMLWGRVFEGYFLFIDLYKTCNSSSLF